MVPHSSETLTKFCSASAGQQILESRRLRWSAPHLFQDPFELTHDSQLNFEPQSLLDAAIQAATAMIFAKEDPRGNAPLANAIRRWRSEERFASPDEAYDVLKELLSRVVDRRLGVIEKVMTDWRKFARSLRICSFSGRPDNLCGWQRFADQHRGLALRFQMGTESSFPEPVKIQYRDTRPEISALKDEMSVIMMDKRHVAQDSFHNKFSHKGLFCADEDEWRCFYQAEDEMSSIGTPATQWFDERSFERSDLKAIYLGALMPAEEKRAIYGLAKDYFRDSKIYQCKLVPGQYNLEFERLSRA